LVIFKYTNLKITIMDKKLRVSLELVLWAHGVDHTDVDQIRADLETVLGYTPDQVERAENELEELEESGEELDGSYEF
jgi:hypothetical protein